MAQFADGITDKEWEDIFSRLLAYAHMLLKTKSWFRGNKTDVFLEGKKAEDYVMEAITRFLENQDGYNPARGLSLVNYLKLHILRQLISNDAKSSENKVTTEIALPNSEDEDEESRFKEAVYPYFKAYFDEEIDTKNIIKHIEKEVSTDEIAEQIFLGICISGMKRREVIADFGLSETDFDNGMRRLKTILKSTAKAFGIKIKAA